MPTAPRPRHRLAAAAAPALVALVLALATAPAGAQVDASATDVRADGRTTVVVTVASGCDGADTTALRLALPEGATDVEPGAADGGMTATVEDGAVTWAGGSLPADEPGRLELALRVPQPAGTEIPLPAVQICGDVEVSWQSTGSGTPGYGDGSTPVLVVPEGATAGAAEATTTTVDEDRPPAAAVAAAPEDESALGGGAVGFMVFAGVMVALAGGATYLVIRSRKA